MTRTRIQRCGTFATGTIAFGGSKMRNTFLRWVPILLQWQHFTFALFREHTRGPHEYRNLGTGTGTGMGNGNGAVRSSTR